ncbi:MAG TPA: restriction endonuclease subunit S [Anaerolineaceae bacterium]
MSKDNWPTVRLKDITTKIGSGATPRGGKESYRSDGISLIRSLNVYDFIFSYDDLAYINDDQARQLDNVNVEKNDILLNITGASVARCCMVPENVLPARVNQHVSIVRINPGLADPFFVYYVINSPRYKTYLLNLAQGGATREALTKETIENFEVPLPEFQLQKNIARILFAYDDLIENNTRRIQILEEMAQAIYREWFVHFRYPGHEGTCMVLSDVGELPKGWEVVNLEDVCRRITDGSHASPASVDNGFPMASVKDMTNWDFDIRTCRIISESDYQKLVKNDCMPLLGDVVIAKDGSYLKHIFVIQEQREMVILSSIAILRPNEKISSQYLALHLLDPSVKSRMAGYVSGAALPRIILKDFRKFKILLPKANILQDFTNLVAPLFQLCFKLTKENANLRQQRDLLLPRLISGEIEL